MVPVVLTVHTNTMNMLMMRKNAFIAVHQVTEVDALIAPQKSISTGMGQTSVDGAVLRAPAADAQIILTGYMKNNFCAAKGIT
jgi:hypothetical protein